MIDIRQLGPDDGAVLDRLYSECLDKPMSAAVRESLLASPGMWAALAWVATTEGPAPAGFVIARSIAGEAEIIGIGVDPAWRRTGIGGALLTDAMSRAVALGAQAIFLEVGEDNPGAVALYRRAGFAPAGRRPGYYRRKSRHPVAALIMRHTVKKSDS